MQISTAATIEGAAPEHSIYVYVTGLGSSYSVEADDSTVLLFNVTNHKTFAIPGLGSVMELEVTIPDYQTLKKLKDARRHGPVLFTKIKAVDKKNGPGNSWPLCILLNVPVILGVTKNAVQSGGSFTPQDTYADLLKQNLTTLVKGTTPGAIRRGSAMEDPNPDVFIYGCNFNKPWVMPADIPSGNRLFYSSKKNYPRKVCTVELDFSIGPLQKKFQFDLQEIGVSLPTIADLQYSNNYRRNTALMAFGVKIVNGLGAGEESNIWNWPMWLPMPVIRQVEPDKNRGYGNAFYLGNETCPNDQGEVRWYLDNPDNVQKLPLDKYVQGIAPELQKIQKIPFDKLSQIWSFDAQNATITLTQEMVGILKDVREAGELCEIGTKPNSWVDDTVLFHPPFEVCYQDTCGTFYDPEIGDPERGVQPWTSFADLPADWVCPYCGNGKDKFTATNDRRYKTMGFVVVWRGDIPSLPLPVNLVEYAKALAQRLWRPVYGSGITDYDVPIPIPVGELIQMGVERLEDVANELVSFINKTDGITVRFAFLTGNFDTTDFKIQDGGLSCLAAEFASNKWDFFKPELEPGKTGVGSKALQFFYDPRAGEFSLQLNVFIGGKVTLFGQEVIIPDMDFPIGPKLKFIPEPLDFPSVAIFFEKPNFEGTALVALPKGTGLFGQNEVHIDAETPGDNIKRVNFINHLSKVNDVLKVVEFFSPNQGLDKITSVVSELLAIGRSIIDSTGLIENAGDCVIDKGNVFGNTNFNDRICSVIMIGLPYVSPGCKIQCWEHSLRRPDLGMCLTLKMPEGKFIFTLPDFTQIPRGDFDANTLDPNAPYSPYIDFHNKITGIKFLKE
jgi:rubredoxin